ncbi:endonuclease [Mycoplasmopsis cricetuli]|uniref:endonuclease n=1 Tax=Mycoplasmopsis cricetuli TaxID=171283 RepID=UPI0004712588|nr:endonuclease [Mycoplasmopsis cricetuli]
MFNKKIFWLTILALPTTLASACTNVSNNNVKNPDSQFKLGGGNNTLKPEEPKKDSQNDNFKNQQNNINLEKNQVDFEVISYENIDKEFDFAIKKGWTSIRFRKIQNNEFSAGKYEKQKLLKLKENLNISKISNFKISKSQNYEYLEGLIDKEKRTLLIEYIYEEKAKEILIDLKNKTIENKSKKETAENISTNLNKEQKIFAQGHYLYDQNNNYYESANGLSGKELFIKLGQIQQSHAKSTTYNKLPSFYDNYNAFKDLYFEKDNTLLDLYSENPTGKDPYTYKDYKTHSKSNGKEEGQGVNREHIVPQSWFNKENSIKSDAQFVWPSDIKVNQVRDNYPHDNVEKIIWKSKNGSKLGLNALGKKVFEINDAFKGDVARAYLYFSLTYQNKNIFENKTNIFIKKQKNMLFPNINDHFLKTYLNWNNLDKVDLFDITRNEEIYKHWNNLRNPFIDYPNLAENLYGQNPKPFVNKGVLVGILK